MCHVTEHPLGESDIDCAIITLSGRYPETGSVTNTKVKEMVYVQSGQGSITIENKQIELNTGDLILLEPNEVYYWNGHMTLFVSCTPAWSPEQHITIPDKTEAAPHNQ